MLSTEAVRHHLNKLRHTHLARPVNYDSGLANAAKKRSLTLSQLPSIPMTSSQPRGNESIFVVINSGDSSSQTDLTKVAIDSWYNQFSRYDFGFDGKITSQVVASWKAADFARIVWKATRRVGVGVTQNGNRSVVVMVFDPPGLGLIQDVITNVRSSTADLFSALENYHTKEESDARYLSTSGLEEAKGLLQDEITSNVSTMVSSDISDLQTEVRSFYVRTADLHNVIEQELVGYATENYVINRIEDLDPRFLQIESNVTGLDEKITVVQSNLQVAIQKNEDHLLSLQSNLDDNHFTKDESTTLFASDAAFQKLKGDVFGKYLDSEQLENQFTSRLRLAAFSNSVSNQFEATESNLNEEIEKLREDLDKLAQQIEGSGSTASV